MGKGDKRGWRVRGDAGKSCISKNWKRFVRLCQWGLKPFLWSFILISWGAASLLCSIVLKSWGKEGVRGIENKYANQIKQAFNIEAWVVCWTLNEDGVEEGVLLLPTPVRFQGDWVNSLVLFWYKKKKKERSISWEHKSFTLCEVLKNLKND